MTPPTPERPFRILVLCTGNSARSQIAEALLASRGAGRIIAASAGSHPASQVSRGAIEVLARHGISWTGRVPKGLDQVDGVRHDLVITVCDNAAEACPYFPGAVAQVHWGLPDPAGEDTPEAARIAFEATWQALAVRIDALLALPLETLPSAGLVRAAAEIHAAA